MSSTQIFVPEPTRAKAFTALRAVPHVTVCICTFRRPELLQRLLAALEQQRTGREFTFSVVVADNDRDGSGRAIAEGFAATSRIHSEYCVEPQQNIALARNRAIAHAQGEFIAFIDDDEFPVADWLRLMVHTCIQSGVSGVLGPVRPHFDTPPPSWVVRGRFCERPEHPTGTVMPWAECRTGNVLFRRAILTPGTPPFRPQFGSGGEDVDFFKRMVAEGHTFVWCNEAVAYEVVPPSRLTRSYMLKRALLRGRNTLKLPGSHVGLLLQSLIAVPLYSVCIVATAAFAHHVAVKFLVKLCDHLGRLLAAVGLNPVSERSH